MAAAQTAEIQKDEVVPDIYDEEYRNKFQPEPTDRIRKQQQKHQV